jgi:hypothetical protein
MSRKEMLLWFGAACCLCLFFVSLFSPFFAFAHGYISRATWHTRYNAFFLTSMLVAVGFLFLGFLSGLRASKTRGVREAFGNYFGSELLTALRRKQDRFLLQARVNSILKSDAQEFDQACRQENEFLGGIKNVKLVTNEKAEELTRQRSELAHGVQWRKERFWKALESARLNGFKVVPKLGYYLSLSWETEGRM